MNEVDTGASGSSCGGGGGGVGGGGRVTRKSGGIRETGRRRDSSEDGLPFSFLSVCQGICRPFKRKSKPQKSSILAFPQCCNLSIWIIAPVSEFCRYQQRRCLPPFELRRNKKAPSWWCVESKPVIPVKISTAVSIFQKEGSGWAFMEDRSLKTWTATTPTPHLPRAPL